jgi:ABC-type multidrug transport system ATPase subunit/peptidoglycan/LPS O-acetylase OafA/YrhL
MSHTERLHSLDGLRAFALLMGIALHATMSFLPGLPPGIWATVDEQPSAALGQLFFVTHVFRMTLFFVIAGYFARLLVQRRGVRGFWSNRLVRIGVPLVVGWIVIYPAIASVWGWGLREYFGGKLPAMPAQMTAQAGFFPLAHLWFLYYLLLTYAVLMTLRAVLARVDGSGSVAGLAQRALGWLVRSGLAALVLGLPVAAVLASLPRWVMWGGVPTPDMTLIPQLPALVAYGTALGVGWLMHRTPEMLELLPRRWVPNALLAAVAIGGCGIAGRSVGFGPLLPFAYVVGTWSAVLALMGLALRFLARESRVRRYVADSSYWLYLAHLPVVAAFAVVVRHWPVHWSVKYGFILGASLAVLLASYHLLVRPSFIGRVLNGRTVPVWRRRAAAAVDARVDEHVAAGDAVAELRGVTKRFGRQTALDGVDLDVRRGELLALLGPNGAGKSTAIGLWLGLTEADVGTVRLMGGSPHDMACRRRIGVMMQDVSLAHGMRVRELVAQTSGYYTNPRTVDETLALARIERLAGKVYDKLSGGQKRQVQFALAICGRPELLFLDEPSVGLDVEARSTMWATIRQLLKDECSIVLTTHYLEEAEALADRVTVLAQGRVIASGAVDEIRSVVSRREIRCESVLHVEQLQAWPGVLAASRDAQRLCLTVADAESVLRRLLAADASLSRLEVRQAGLAEAFAQLTKEAA